ncbi:STAS-like domain-containing protein [Escherichia coli]
MNKIAYKLPEGDLASRNQAIPQRHKIEGFIKEGYTVDLDLSGVYSISESYSDEIFGVLVVKFGVTKVLSQVKVRNAPPSILKKVLQK